MQVVLTLADGSSVELGMIDSILYVCGEILFYRDEDPDDEPTYACGMSEIAGMYVQAEG